MIYQILFYILAGLMIVTTAIAVTRRNMVHAVIYLVLSFFGSALLFYLMGAPLLAALEVIVYAGAIMILFLFIIMMIKTDVFTERMFPLKQWLPAAALGFVYLIFGGMLIAYPDRDIRQPIQVALAEPGIFGHFLFRQHWLAIEIVSLLLLVALIGAYLIGSRREKQAVKPSGDDA